MLSSAAGRRERLRRPHPTLAPDPTALPPEPPGGQMKRSIDDREVGKRVDKDGECRKEADPWRRSLCCLFQGQQRRQGTSAQEKGEAMTKNTICLWYDKDAEAAARFYAETFPDSTVGAVLRAPSDFPSGKAGDVLTVE